VVVVLGLTVRLPLRERFVLLPGVIETDVAPVVVQASVAEFPVTILAGVTVKLLTLTGRGIVVLTSFEYPLSWPVVL
jgi:hypothetical protein